MATCNTILAYKKNQPLFGHPLAFIMKNISEFEKIFLRLKTNLHHETTLTLTHVSTTLNMHWGSWQLDWAEGLGSFASGKEFGSSTCPAFNTYIISDKQCVDPVSSEIHNVSLWGLQCERMMHYNIFVD